MNAETPQITIVDAQTGQTITRDMTLEELEQIKTIETNHE